MNLWPILSVVYAIITAAAITHYIRRRTSWWMGVSIGLIVAPPFLAAAYWLLFRIIVGLAP